MTLAMLLLTGCVRSAKTTPTAPKDLGFTPTPSADVLAPLAGFRIWVQVKDPSTRQGWCDAFAEQGLIVNCDQDPWVDEYEVFLKCPDLPDETGALLAAFTNQPGLDVWDWRTDPDFGPAYCTDSQDGISLELLR